MIIQSTQSYRFVHPDTGEECKVAKGFVGDVPAWVTKLPYFHLACQDGSITQHLGNATAPAEPSPPEQSVAKQYADARKQPPAPEIKSIAELDVMTKKELDAFARERGIQSPEKKLRSRAAVIEAIMGTYTDAR
jgi:hypothetical protein